MSSHPYQRVAAVPTRSELFKQQEQSSVVTAAPQDCPVPARVGRSLHSPGAREFSADTAACRMTGPRSGLAAEPAVFSARDRWRAAT